jgi:uncharacterized membrane protein YhaH (DUF805 family)
MQILKVLSSYQGRIPRRIYWAYVILAAIVWVVASVAALLIGIGLYALRLDVIAIFLIFAPWVLMAPFSRAALKRCHDRNHSGSYIFFLFLVPLLGPLWLMIELGLLRGTVGPNRFGPDPG